MSDLTWTGQVGLMAQKQVVMGSVCVEIAVALRAGVCVRVAHADRRDWMRLGPFPLRPPTCLTCLDHSILQLAASSWALWNMSSLGPVIVQCVRIWFHFRVRNR